MPKWKFYKFSAKMAIVVEYGLQNMVTKENQSKGKRGLESNVLGLLQLQPFLAPGVLLH